jgi:surface protein
MFYDNLKLNSLDISSFDFSQLNTNTNSGMFTNVPATTVYVKDQANVDTLNALSDKPSTITFVVKP